MKKPVILALIAMYVLSIVVVGYMGGAFKLYNPVQYVESIVCENEEAVETHYTGEDRKQGGDFYISKEFTGEELIFDVVCKVLPVTATETGIEYFCVESDWYTMEYDSKTGTAKLTVSGTGTIMLLATSVDSVKEEIIIRIDII